jgi:hypothetical protein
VLREAAAKSAEDAPVPVRVIDGVSERLPAEDESFDAGGTAAEIQRVGFSTGSRSHPVRRSLRSRTSSTSPGVGDAHTGHPSEQAD